MVNAANAALAPGGGVCGAIFGAAGAELLVAAGEALGGCARGDAKATDGFDLAARWIIHTVGPVVARRGSGGRRPPRLLLPPVAGGGRRARRRSIAFPAISTGIYGFPAERAAAIAVSAVRSYSGGVQLVRLVAFDESTLGRYRALLG